MSDGMDMDAHESTPTMQATATQAAGPMSYFAYGKHSTSIVVHIALMVLGWCFVLPAGKQRTFKEYQWLE